MTKDKSSEIAEEEKPIEQPVEEIKVEEEKPIEESTVINDLRNP